MKKDTKKKKFITQEALISIKIKEFYKIWSRFFYKKNSKLKNVWSLYECDRAGARTQDPLLKREMLYQLSYQVMVILRLQI